jgi:hypothetical protein
VASLFLVIVYVTRHLRWSPLLDLAMIWFLWRAARPTAARWTRPADLADTPDAEQAP